MFVPGSRADDVTGHECVGATGADDVLRRVNVRDAANGFAGEFAETGAAVSFSATEAGFRFTSAPAATSTSAFAEVGHERNGTFFRHA